MVNSLEAYPYSSYHYFLDSKNIPECLEKSWIVQSYQEDIEAIQAFLTSAIDTSQLEEMRKASSLIEAPNIDKKPDEHKLKKQLLKVKDIKERNQQIVEAYKEGYSQQMIANVLNITQQAVFAVIKRARK